MPPLPTKLVITGAMEDALLRQKINDIITYLEAKEEKERYENELILDRASNWARPAKENFHSETKEPMFKAEDIEIIDNSPYLYIIVNANGFETREAAEQAREALLRLTK